MSQALIILSIPLGRPMTSKKLCRACNANPQKATPTRGREEGPHIRTSVLQKQGRLDTKQPLQLRVLWPCTHNASDLPLGWGRLYSNIPFIASKRLHRTCRREATYTAF